MVSMRPRHMVVKRTGTDGESLFSNGLILELCSDATLRNWGVGLDVDMKVNGMQFGELCCDETLLSLGEMMRAGRGCEKRGRRGKYLERGRRCLPLLAKGVSCRMHRTATADLLLRPKLLAIQRFIAG